MDRNQLFFNELNVKRLPGYPKDDGKNAKIKFYVNYPSIVRNDTVEQAILASIISAEREKLERLTGFSITVDTSVTPPNPADPSDDQSNNAVELLISSFSVNQVRTSILIIVQLSS